MASLPEKDGDKRVIELYARVRGGITARLAAVANKGTLKTSRVLLDGPYGGFDGNLHVYDRVLLLAGGSGMLLSLNLWYLLLKLCYARRDLHCTSSP